MIRHRSFAGRVVVVALVLVFSVVSASAYTIVMRDGRRVEIPNNFTVTSSTLTYEAGTGIQITIQLNTVDIAATERANGEAAGSFLRKATTPKPAVALPVQADPGASRSITNRDLENYRRARIESEKEYEQQRKQLGLPSREERRREVEEIEDRTLEQVRNMRRQQELEEADRRAAALRTELAALEAQIGFARRRVDEIPATYPFDAFPLLPWGTVGFSTGFGSFKHSRFHQFPFTGFPPFPLNPILLGHGVHFGSRPFRARAFIRPPAFRSRPFHSRPMNRRRH